MTIYPYKNILADKYISDTNFVIIKDTDDIEELELQWNKFNSYMTPRQQRLSDDESIRIWNMTNLQHYEALKRDLIKPLEIEDKKDEPFISDNLFPDIGGSIVNISNINEDRNIKLDLDNSHHELKDDKNDNAEDYETLSNIGIVGKIDGDTAKEKLDDLEKEYSDFNAQGNKLKKKSDDKCRELYGVSNKQRYEKEKSKLLEPLIDSENNAKSIKADEDGLDVVHKSVSEDTGFVKQVNELRLEVLKEEENRPKITKRIHDTPYFTPQEMIDLGVYGNYNFYDVPADNDGLTTKIKTSTWFDSYQNMYNYNRVLEDYRKEWISKLNELYSDYDDIKKCGDEEKILARKQSILELGWNPEIPFTLKNREKASIRIYNMMEQETVKDEFFKIDDLISGNYRNILFKESVNKDEYDPVFLIFTKGKTPVVSAGIRLFTGSSYTHASIGFDPELNESYSYNMNYQNFGFVRENISSFKDNVIGVYCFFIEKSLVDKLKLYIQDFANHRTFYDHKILFNKIFNINYKPTKNKFDQVCSTFVDSCLKFVGINLSGKNNIAAPSDLVNGCKTNSNKIIELFVGKATQYPGKDIKNKVDRLMDDETTESINESNYQINIVDDIINDTCKYLVKYTNESSYKRKWNGYFFFKFLNIHKESYGDYGSIQICDTSPEQYDYKENEELEKEKFYEWYNDLLKVGIDYIDSKYSDELNDNNIIISIGDGDECNIFFNRKSMIKTILKNKQINESSNVYYYDENNNERFDDVMLEFIQDMRNGVNPFSNKTFYHISFESDLDEHGPLKPRIPSWITNELKKDKNFLEVLEKNKTDNSKTGTGFEEYKTPRVCFSNSIEGCLNAIINDIDRLELAGKTLYVYTPEKPISEYKHKTNKQILKDGDIFDANITNEMWILEPVNLKYVGSIVVDKVTNEHVKKFANNKNRSIIKYDYKWHWFHKIKKHHINESTPILNEACKDIKSAREFVSKVGELAKKYDANYFIVTDGASGIHNNGNPAVKNARDSQIKWEKKHGFDPDEDWSKKSIKEVTLPTSVTLRNATKDDTDNMFKWKMESIDKGIRNDPKVIKYIEKDVQDSIKITKMIMYKDETIGMFTTDKLNDGYWYIGEIYIVKEHRNKGIGTALLKDEISKHDKIKLKVAQSNHGAMKLYKSLGFEITDRNDEGKLYIMTLDKKEKSIREQTSIFNEVKQFPIEFDKDGNLIIYKARTGTLAFGDEIDDSVQLLESYRNTNNQEGLAYELSRVWFMITSIEKKLAKKKNLSEEDERNLIRNRTTAINVFKTNLQYLMKLDNSFNFRVYYNNTPFSDNGYTITANTFKYSLKALKSIIM